MQLASDSYILRIAYILAAILIIVGLKRLSSPVTARSGNQLAAVGVGLALLVTLLNNDIQDFPWIVGGVIIGTVAGYIMAKRVQMTAMPQMVALFNGMGGGAAALVAASEFLHRRATGAPESLAVLVATLLGLIIGSLSIAGSLIAFGKLQGLVSPRPVTYPAQKIVNGIVAAIIAALSLYMLLDRTSTPAFVGIAVAALVLGVAVVMPIGGADMPVVISLLNSFTGLAVAMTGFVLNNPVLIIAGTLVGASGTLLTQLMSKAMNRSLTNVLFGAFGSAPAGGAAGAGAGAASGVSLRETSVEDAATLLAYSRSVVVVPGYGLAVAQAQQTVRELAELLEKRGVEVKYAIHPVAGRMPGHMNVLLAEANIPYTQLREMDDINPEFPQTDVALVIGANDVTNPAARTNASSPIFGMPILNVDQAQNIIVIKRGRGTGFAGIENDLFANPKTSMLYGDAKDALSRLVAATKVA